jgi:hypothetical protein
LVLENTRNVIPPYELDIFIPEKNLAIEYCGLYWHSDIKGKSKDYHLNKYTMCMDKGVRLLTVFEDEYLTSSQEVLNRIREVISSPYKPLYVKKDNLIISDLCWDWHNSESHYNKLGYEKKKETGPLLYKKVKISEHNNVIYGKVWNCGEIIYEKSQ